ncbi:palmitoyltransferase ZDHHC2 isoform X1 [Acipenser ruthenus]|uniref:palmitoyltransferase ZDHHC2 isoform X1 n=1 Tax=Acipenser ruthenus TaxID=7906 RepID=UPI00145A9463|nr:palmitoyltransferase ZDHHC2 isoform X1 [Acipenser ruthenus]
MAPSGSSSIKRSCRRVLYWIPVLFITMIVGWSYYAYVIQLCIGSITNIGEKVVCVVAYHLFFIMFSWAYWKTIFTTPMNPSKEFHLSYTDREILEREERGETQQEVLRRIAKDLPIYTRTLSGAIRYCDRCQLVKPDRCHHCSVCDKCILKMDHHCPWVNNCVGFSNYKFFLLFLAYSLLYCLFIAATDLQYFIKFWTADGNAHRRLKEYWNGLPDTQAKFHIMFLFFSAAMFSISLASLFGYHCWLVSKNRSTLEAFRAPAFRHGADKNGFSLGFGKNLRQVFGDEKKYWFLPVFSSLGDGCSFPTCLVNQDPEQPSTPAGLNTTVKSVGDASPFPAKPLRESQSRLLISGQSWTESDGGHEEDKHGTSNPAMVIENET